MLPQTAKIEQSIRSRVGRMSVRISKEFLFVYGDLLHAVGNNVRFPLIRPLNICFLLFFPDFAEPSHILPKQQQRHLGSK